MKKFIIATVVIFALALAGAYLYFYEGWGGDLFSKDGDVHTFTATEGRTILVDQGDGLKEFEIRGVDLGAGKPGHFATDYALDKETYLRWFAQIQEHGRQHHPGVHARSGDAFYEAFYEIQPRTTRDPLYLIHGVWVNDYVGVLAHGRPTTPTSSGPARIRHHVPWWTPSTASACVDAGTRGLGTGIVPRGTCRHWVLGYIVGVEWEDRARWPTPT